MIELRHMDVRHFVIEYHHLAKGCKIKCGYPRVHMFEVISLSIMSGRNNMLYMLYTYCRMCFGIDQCMQNL